MTQLEQKARQARNRIALNAWLDHLCAATMAASGVFAGLVVVARVLNAALPLNVIGAGLAGMAVAVSVVVAVAGRVDLATAATVLDEAAGTRERVSSGLLCAGSRSNDPFAKAVVVDAQHVATGLHVDRHLRLKAPRRLSHASVALMLVGCAFLVPRGLLADEPAEPDPAAIQAANVIRQKTESIKKKARTNPALKPLADELEKLAETPENRRMNADQLRQIALRKLDKMKDALRQQKGDEKYKNAEQFKKMMRALKNPSAKDSAVSKLSQALAKGDFKAAVEQVNAIRKQLAETASKGDPQKAKELQKQLERLSKNIESLAADQKLAQQLKQAGIKKQDIQRMMKNLTKEDLQKLRKQLQKKGLSQKQIDKISKQLKRRSGASAMAGKLAQSLKQAGAAAGSGKSGQAAEAMKMAADQLSEMESLEQEMSELDASMAELQNAMGDLGNPCSQCNGTGRVNGGNCPKCNGSGSRSGMGGRGRGRGGIAPEQQTRSAFVKRKEKVKTTRGAIIGRTMVEGRQIKGTDSAAVREVITAAERDATDSINRARIPRRYHRSIKQYFSDLRRQYGIKDRSVGRSQPKDGPSSSSTGDTSKPKND